MTVQLGLYKLVLVLFGNQSRQKLFSDVPVQIQSDIGKNDTKLQVGSVVHIQSDSCLKLLNTELSICQNRSQTNYTYMYKMFCFFSFFENKPLSHLLSNISLDFPCSCMWTECGVNVGADVPSCSKRC